MIKNSPTPDLSYKLGVPDYSNMVSLTSSTGFAYTPTENGYIQARALAGLSNATYFKIYLGTSSSGTLLCGYINQAYNQHPTMIIPVKGGETYYCQCNHVNDYRFYFIPTVGGGVILLLIHKQTFPNEIIVISFNNYFKEVRYA